MNRHTPGPWEEKITGDGLVWVIMPDAHRVSIGDMEETCGICHANARLIAAAPDLLAALEDIRDLARTGIAPDSFNLDVNEWAQHRLLGISSKSAKAIAKIEGK